MALPDNDCCRSLDLPRDAISTALVPSALTCPPEGPSENKGQHGGQLALAKPALANRLVSATVHRTSRREHNSFLGASSPCAALRSGRDLCSEAVWQAALCGIPTSHISAGACGRPAGRCPTTIVAEASTCHAMRSAPRSSPQLVPAPTRGQARIRGLGSGTNVVRNATSSKGFDRDLSPGNVAAIPFRRSILYRSWYVLGLARLHDGVSDDSVGAGACSRAKHF
jgi:hypothetical protein